MAVARSTVLADGHVGRAVGGGAAAYHRGVPVAAVAFAGDVRRPPGESARQSAICWWHAAALGLGMLWCDSLRRRMPKPARRQLQCRAAWHVGLPLSWRAIACAGSPPDLARALRSARRFGMMPGEVVRKPAVADYRRAQNASPWPLRSRQSRNS